MGEYFPHDPTLSQVSIRDLENGRGIQTLGGLTGPVQWVLFAPDGRKLAALSRDWRLAIWDVRTGRLDAILNAPKGYSADNAGLAFHHGLHAAAVPGTPCFRVEDWHDGPGGHFQELQALDAVSGKALWSQRWEHEETGPLLIDPRGELVVVGPRDQVRQKPAVRKAMTGKVVRWLDAWPGSPGPDGKSFVDSIAHPPGVSLHNFDNRILLSLGIDQRTSSNPLFSTDGKHVAWGNADGNVMIADLDEIESRLVQAGPSW